MKAPMLIIITAVVLGAGSALAIMNNACKSGHHAWCAPTSSIRHHAKSRAQLNVPDRLSWSKCSRQQLS
jgi:hypothetical protein